MDVNSSVNLCFFLTILCLITSDSQIPRLFMSFLASMIDGAASYPGPVSACLFFWGNIFLIDLEADSEEISWKREPQIPIRSLNKPAVFHYFPTSYQQICISEHLDMFEAFRRMGSKYGRNYPNFNWLVVSNIWIIFHFIYGMSFPLTNMVKTC